MVRRKTQMTNKLRKTMSLLTGLVFAFVLAFGVLAACKDTEETPRFTVTFLDGESVIAEREVEEGGTVASFTPEDKGYEKEGFVFEGWYATADFTHDWSFDTVIEKDTNVYSMWSSSKEDTRQWTIAGESSAGGPLREIGWNGGISDANLLTKSADKNEFTITIDLYSGDKFQLCVQDENGVWQSTDDGTIISRGGQYLEENEYMSAPGTGLGDGQVNITVGTSGNYTLTLTTDFYNNDYGKITVVRNGDAPEITIDRTSYSWYIYGTSSEQNETSILGDMNWGGGYGEEGLTSASSYAMKKTSDNDPDGTGTFVLTGKFNADDEFLFAVLTVGDKRLNAESGTMFYYQDIDEFNGLDENFTGSGEDGTTGNIKVKTAGFYTFTLTVTLNEETNMLEGSIEVEDNVAILQSGNWIVMGNRLSYEQVTGTDAEGNANIANGQLGIEMEQAAYDNYNSDVNGAENNFGKGDEDNLAKLTKNEEASTDGKAVYEITLTLDVGDYFYFAIPEWVYNVADFGQSYYGTVNAMYGSQVVPGTVEGDLPEGLDAVWTNNFVCLEAGDYEFVITIDADGTLALTVEKA